MKAQKPNEKPVFYKNRHTITWEKIYFREYGVQYSIMMVLCLSPKARLLIGKPITKHIVVPDGEGTALYADRTAWKKLSEFLHARYATSTEKLDIFEKKFLSAGKEYERFTDTIKSTDVRKCDNQTLLKLYLDYQERLFNYTTFLASVFILNNYVSQRAMDLLDAYLEKNALTVLKQEVQDSLFFPEKRAAVLEMQYLIRKSQTDDPVNIDDIYEKFKWLPCQDLHNTPWTKKQFLEEVELYKSSGRIAPKPFSHYAHLLKITKTDYDYFLVAKHLVYLKDLRDEFRRRGIYNVLNFFAEITRRMGVKTADIRYLEDSDIIAFLKDGRVLPQRTIAARKKGFVVYLNSDNESVVLEGSTIKILMNAIGLGAEDTQDVTVHGYTASKGTARGKVVIVRGLADISKVQKGSILIAVTTHPDYTLAMGKASAIVTDEGGVTCHAAIVARELNIPCIVGTGNATKVLKNGDYVRVEADKGIVMKIDI